MMGRRLVAVASVAAKTAAPKTPAVKSAAVKVEGSPDAGEPEVKAEVKVEEFTWKPKSGGDPIVLPSATAAVPKGRTLRFFYHMNKLQGDIVAQAAYALRAAGVPESVRDSVFDTLDDDETVELLTAWAAAISGATPGES